MPWAKIPELICYKEFMSRAYRRLGTAAAVTHAPNSEAKDGNVSTKSRRSNKSTAVVVPDGQKILWGELFHKFESPKKCLTHFYVNYS